MTFIRAQCRVPQCNGFRVATSFSPELFVAMKVRVGDSVTRTSATLADQREEKDDGPIDP